MYKKFETKTERITLTAMMTALIVICTWVSVPTTVSFTMQTFAIFVASGVLGMKYGTLSVLAYIGLGVAGFPVFSNFTGGLGALLGTTGGYIIGFIFLAMMVGYSAEKFSKNYPALFASMALGTIICYSFGTAWFMFVYMNTTGAVGLMTVLSWCVFPFIIPDLVKMGLAILVLKRMHTVLKIH